MTAKVSDVAFAKGRSVGPTMVPQMTTAENGGDAKTKIIVATMADSLSPLLTSMKLFGLYFRRGTDVQSETSRRKWNVYMIYAAVTLILTWINVIRMFSVF